MALPWYLLVYQRNGYAFVEDFFLKQHFQRFYSRSLEHVQPWYFYVPVLLGILFPWTPLFAWLVTRTKWDERRKLLIAICAFGIVFFSASFNKLPGYLLPLVPLLFTLLGSTFEGRPSVTIRKRWLLPCAVLVALIPLIADALPAVLGTGRITLADGRSRAAARAEPLLRHASVLCPRSDRCGLGGAPIVGSESSRAVCDLGRLLHQDHGLFPSLISKYPRARFGTDRFSRLQEMFAKSGSGGPGFMGSAFMRNSSFHRVICIPTSGI